MLPDILPVIAIILGIIAIILIARKIFGGSRKKSGRQKKSKWDFFDPVKRAGRRGEVEASKHILNVLHPGDFLLRNVTIRLGEKEAEMDNIVVNKCGVFIIEVKDYKGRLYGNETDFEWIKVKDDGYGNTFQKVARNPIPQVKRQVHIVAKYLESCGIRVWVEGYAYFLNNNSPVKSEYVLQYLSDIDRAVHTFTRNRLSAKEVEEIKKILECGENG